MTKKVALCPRKAKRSNIPAVQNNGPSSKVRKMDFAFGIGSAKFLFHSSKRESSGENFAALWLQITAGSPIDNGEFISDRGPKAGAQHQACTQVEELPPGYRAVWLSIPRVAEWHTSHPGIMAVFSPFRCRCSVGIHFFTQEVELPEYRQELVDHILHPFKAKLMNF